MKLASLKHSCTYNNCSLVKNKQIKTWGEVVRVRVKWCSNIMTKGRRTETRTVLDYTPVHLLFRLYLQRYEKGLAALQLCMRRLTKCFSRQKKQSKHILEKKRDSRPMWGRADWSKRYLGPMKCLAQGLVSDVSPKGKTTPDHFGRDGPRRDYAFPASEQWPQHMDPSRHL